MIKILANEEVNWNHKIVLVGHWVAKRSKSLLLTQKSARSWDDVLKLYSIREAGEYNLSNNSVTGEEIPFEKVNEMFGVFASFLILSYFGTTKFFSPESIREQKRMGEGCNINNTKALIIMTVEKWVLYWL